VGRLAGKPLLADIVRILAAVLVAVRIDRVGAGHMADRWHMIVAGKASHPSQVRSTTCHLKQFTCCDAKHEQDDQDRTSTNAT
jgi:hypothetical protein